MLLKDLSYRKIKTIVSNFYLKSYQFIDHAKKRKKEKKKDLDM